MVVPKSGISFSFQITLNHVFRYIELISIRWSNPRNVYRTTWGTNNIPALVRYEQVNGKVTETGRLVEAEILNRKRLREFIV